MDETTREIIERITSTSGTLPDGRNLQIFYDCDKLTPSELTRLAAQAVGHLPEDAFDIAVGIAYKGILFAAAIAAGRNVSILQADGQLSGPAVAGQKVVLVDDVVSSGDRIIAAERKLESFGAKVVAYCCIVDRSDGKFGTNAKPLFSALQTNML